MFPSMRKGQRYHCQNTECGSEIEVTKESAAEGAANPRCACGAEMKKAYVKPSVTTRPLERPGAAQGAC